MKFAHDFKENQKGKKNNLEMQREQESDSLFYQKGDGEQAVERIVSDLMLSIRSAAAF